ncbi:MAG: fibronectin type III domain-containing protein, partial [Acidimicrobiia bacterium]
GDDLQGEADGGDDIVGYDVVLTPSSGTPVTCFFAGDTPNATDNQFSRIVSSDDCTGAVTNDTAYDVAVAARNGAGESDPSSAKEATPCADCVVAIIDAGQPLTILTGQTSPEDPTPTVAVEISQAETSCETLLAAEEIGATEANPIVACDEYPAGETEGNDGLIASLREDPDEGACGAISCLGGIEYESAVPFDIGNFLREVVILDKTISVDLLGQPCDDSPHRGKACYLYQAFYHGTLIGTSDRDTWCGGPEVPNAELGCIEKLEVLNKHTAPNGADGISDLLGIIRFADNPNKGWG